MRQCLQPANQCAAQLFSAVGTNGDAPLGLIATLPGHHLDAVYDWTDAEAQSAASAVVSHQRQMSLWVELDGLDKQ